MRIRKRSLWGYDPGSVQQVIERIRTDYENTVTELQKEIDDLARTNADLLSQVERLKQAVNSVENETLGEEGNHERFAKRAETFIRIEPEESEGIYTSSETAAGSGNSIAAKET